MSPGARTRQAVMLAVGVTGRAGSAAGDPAQGVIRAALYDVLSGALNGAGIDWSACVHEDRGLGVLVVLPPSVPGDAVADDLPRLLRAGLRRTNRNAAAVTRFGLRLAVHCGQVHHDGRGLVGTAVNHLFRLLEAPELKAGPAEVGHELALIASERFFDDVVRHGPGLVDPRAYRRVTVSVKETETPAWVYVL